MKDWYRARVNATKLRTDAERMARVEAARCAKPEFCPDCKSPGGYLRPEGAVWVCDVCSHEIPVVMPKPKE